jgi:predicted N-formylglutamate amidohydrolase
MADERRSPFIVDNPEGAGPFVIVCDHASNRMPGEYHSLGLSPDALQTHIAWDPGALSVSRRLSAMLDAPLLWPDASRLIVDCNRAPDAPDLILAESEGRPVPGNRDLTDQERSRRLAEVHAPYHAAIDACIARRQATGLETALIAVHSFTPVYLGKTRPWQIGIVFDHDRRLADPLIRRLKADPALTVGVNQPYSPADRVYYTLSRHGEARGLAAVMIEICNNEIAGETGQRRWAERLGDIFATARPGLFGAGHAAA